MNKKRNPVAKHSPTYNRSAVFKDKKREMRKKGYLKREQGSPFLSLFRDSKFQVKASLVANTLFVNLRKPKFPYDCVPSFLRRATQLAKTSAVAV